MSNVSSHVSYNLRVAAIFDPQEEEDLISSVWIPSSASCSQLCDTSVGCRGSQPGAGTRASPSRPRFHYYLSGNVLKMLSLHENGSNYPELGFQMFFFFFTLHVCTLKRKPMAVFFLIRTELLSLTWSAKGAAQCVRKTLSRELT